MGKYRAAQAGGGGERIGSLREKLRLCATSVDRESGEVKGGGGLSLHNFAL